MEKVCYITTVSSTIKVFISKSAEYIHNHTDWDISVICSNDEEFAASLPEYIHYFPVKMERGISISGIKAMLEMKKIFQREKFDLIQYSTPNAALYSAIAGKIAGIKVRNYHLMGFRYLGASGFMRTVLKLIEKVTCQLSTSIECVSKSNLEIGVNARIFPRDKATVVWNGSTGGVDLQRFDIHKREQYRREIRDQFGISSDAFVYGFVGRITRDKGVNEILEAFKHIENAKLMMIGSLEGIQTLDEKLYKDSINNSNIIYTGNVAEVEKYFAALDVLLLPSYREGFGNVVIEAAAMGTPAIVSNIPGPEDGIDEGVTALTVEVKSVRDLTAKMKQIREADYIAMGYNAMEYAAEKFNSKELCEKILERKKLLLEGKVYG